MLFKTVQVIPMIESDSDIIALPRQTKEYLKGINGVKGLFVRVRPNGSKNYQYYYTYKNKQHKLVLGSTKKLTLAFAKGYVVACQLALKANQNPADLKAQGRLVVNPLPFMQKRDFQSLENNTLANVIDEWYLWKFGSDHIYSISTLARWKNTLDPILNEFGATDITKITSNDLYLFFSHLQPNAHSKARTGIDYLNSIFNYANVRGLITQNPCQNIKALLHKRKSQNFPAITNLEEFKQLIIDIHSFTECFLSSSLALRLLPYLFVRIGDFCRMRWQDIDFENRLWQFTPQKQLQFKSSTPTLFTVPLAYQAIELLNEIREINGDSLYVFSSIYNVNNPCIDNSTLTKILHRMGYKNRHCPHGFRASAKSILMEHLGYSHDITELQLDHTIARSHGGAYDRTQRLEKRIEMMQEWANFIEPLP